MYKEKVYKTHKVAIKWRLKASEYLIWMLHILWKTYFTSRYLNGRL